jgi:hypothetical protein
MGPKDFAANPGKWAAIGAVMMIVVIVAAIMILKG